MRAQILKIIHKLIEVINSYWLSRWVFNMLLRIYRYLLSFFYRRVADKLSLLKYYIHGSKSTDYKLLSFISDLQSVRKNLGSDLNRSWEEVNLFNRNKRTVLRNSIGGREDKLPAKDFISPEPRVLIPEKSISKTIDRFFSILIDSGIEAVSFDLFDTLVLRLVNRPKDIFLVVDQNLKDSWSLPEPYSEYRVKAEELARSKSPEEEITIEEIYHEFQIITGFSRERIEEIYLLEIESELKFIRPRKIGVELLKKAREHLNRIYIISDMYLSRYYIDKILASCGLGGFSSVYLSSEIRKTKNSGHLYEIFLRVEKLNPEKVLHIGDNEYSDQIIPARFGIKTFFLPRYSSDKPNFSVGEENLIDSIFQSLEYSMKNPEQVDSILPGPKYQGDPFCLGYSILGSLLIGFISFIYKILQERKYNKIYFISRDGFYFKECYDLLRKHDPGLPESEYLYASRKLIYYASMTNRESIIKTAERDYFSVTLKDLLIHRFMFTGEECDNISSSQLEKFNFSSIENIIDREVNHQEMVDFILSFQEIIIDKSLDYRKRYISYLKDNIVDSNGLLVDIGYNGTLQKYIYEEMGFKLEGLYLTVSEPAKILDELGLVYQSYIHNEQPEYNHFFSHIQFFELFLSAHHPSIIDVRRDNFNRWVPAYDIYNVSSQSKKMLNNLHAGALECVENFLNIATNIIRLNQWSSDRSMDRIRRYLSSPDYEDYIYWNELIFEDSFGGRSSQYAFRRENNDITGIWRGAIESLKLLSIKSPEDTTNCERKLLTYGSFYDPLPTLSDDSPINLIAYFESDQKDQLKLFLTSLHYQVFTKWTLIIGISEDIRIDYDEWRRIYKQDKGLIIPVFFQEGPDAFLKFLHEIIILSDYEWVFFCLPGICLQPEALAEVSVALLGDKEFNVLYFDEIQIKDGDPPQPYFKPDWSPELLISQPYVGGFWGAKKEVLDFVGYAAGTYRMWLYEQLLKISENKAHVFHLCRAIFKYFYNSTPYGSEDYSGIIQASLKRRNIRGEAFNYFKSVEKKGHLYSIKFPDEGPEVAVIIPTRNNPASLMKCIESLKVTTYQNYRIYIIDNQSDDLQTLTYLSKCGHNILKIKSPDGQFNFSYINNKAVDQVKEDYILFLNDDTEVIEARWLSQMVGWLQFIGVGAVGARLIFKDDIVQHAGIVNRLLNGVLPAPAFKLIEKDNDGYHNYAISTRNYSALTAACLLTPRNLFIKMGQFDEERFGVAYNDCDYGFRLTGDGYRNVFCPEALLYHYEGSSRSGGIGNDNPAEEAACIKLYGNWPDPFYNLNLSLENTFFDISSRNPYLYRKKKLRILLFSHNLNYEGAPLVLHEIAKGLKSRGHQPVIVSPVNGPLVEKYRNLNIDIYNIASIDIGNSTRLKLYEDELRRISRSVNMIQADVVVANTLVTWWGIAGASLLDIPYLWIIHESEAPLLHPHLKCYGVLTKKHAETIMYGAYQNIFVSYSTRELYEQFNRNNNMTVIHNSFDVDQAEFIAKASNRSEIRKKLNIAENELCVLTPGTVCERKAQLDLIAMIEKLPQKSLANVKFYIVGDRPSKYSDLLHKAVGRLPADRKKRITIVPETDEIGIYYSAADIMAFPTRLESYPRVIQEAMYSELAIVSTPVFGIKEMVWDEVSALFFPPGDIKEFTNKMIRVLASPKLRKKLTNNAKISMGKMLTFEDMIDRYEELILEAWLSGSPRKL